MGQATIALEDKYKVQGPGAEVQGPRSKVDGPSRVGDPGGARFLEVAVPRPLHTTFTYALPEDLPVPAVGARVLAPFGRSLLPALTVEVHDRGPAKPDLKVRRVRKVLDDEPLLTGPLMELARWISQYYFCPPGEVFRGMLPPGLLSRKDQGRGKTARRHWPTLRQLAVVAVEAPPSQLTKRQREVWEAVSQVDLPALLEPLARRVGCTSALFKTLASKGALSIRKIEVDRSPWAEEAADPVLKHDLNPEQRRITSKIRRLMGEGGFHSLLVHGVTGSGKTEIYLNAISDALAMGRSALVLVPEIALTPQTARAFRGWFGERVAILHSKLSDGERFDQWRRIRQGRAQVVIGTRSAVFAPLSGLGVIIIDEEHDGSYKQEEAPRYNGRDCALKRGQIEGALVVMGSATPQLEVYHQATEGGRHHLATVSSRILERPLPTVHIVDMRAEFQRHGREQPISEFLEQLLEDRLRRRQQALILLNRRGYSPLVICRSCGHVETCKNCSISLTFHQDPLRLICHYCGYGRSIPRLCPECEKRYIHFHGVGTEKMEEILRARFPRAAVDRLDRDTADRKGSLHRILDKFAAGRTDILVGTQMIAKGHDFPGVTLVGVLAADQGLSRPDFRAAERTFQLLTQVAGRAGRGDQPGDVVVQTLYPNHYSLKYACAQDYRLFYRQEIQFRKDFRYPPFTALANLLVQGPERDRTLALAETLAERLRERRDRLSSENRLRVLGPAPAALERLKGDFRFQILLKTTSRRELHEVLAEAAAALDASELSRVTIDVDPVNLL